jgi:hypothetical protein
MLHFIFSKGYSEATENIVCKDFNNQKKILLSFLKRQTAEFHMLFITVVPKPAKIRRKHGNT